MGRWSLGRNYRSRWRTDRARHWRYTPHAYKKRRRRASESSSVAGAAERTAPARDTPGAETSWDEASAERTPPGRPRARPLGLAVVASTNRPGRRDATGAFIPEGNSWARVNRAGVLLVDARSGSPGVQRQRIIDQLFEPEHAGCDQIAFFCHGWADGMEFGFVGEDGAACLASAIQSCTERATVVLYCCSTAQDFAPNLARFLGPDFRVWAHYSRGHTTRNPQLGFFCGEYAENLWAPLKWSDRRRLRATLKSAIRFDLGSLDPRGLGEIAGLVHADRFG